MGPTIRITIFLSVIGVIQLFDMIFVLTAPTFGGPGRAAETMAVTAIEVLLDRLPDIELSVPAHEVRWRPSPWVRGVTALPVAFTPASPQGVH
jgi:hypothetical protein